MLGTLFNNPFLFLLSAIALISAITVHEFAHAYIADKLGDPTARLMGRLTLNPFAHLDPIGTLMILIARFGWGKPVPFDPYNLRHPRRDSAFISLAGPVANMILAITCSVILRFIGISSSQSVILGIISIVFEAIIMMNVSLAFFNLIPIHPMDGFKVVEGILPEDAARQWHQLESIGIILLLVLVFPIFGGSSPILNFINPMIDAVIHLLIPGATVL